jgi:hypothetical protein
MQVCVVHTVFYWLLLEIDGGSLLWRPPEGSRLLLGKVHVRTGQTLHLLTGFYQRTARGITATDTLQTAAGRGRHSAFLLSLHHSR